MQSDPRWVLDRLREDKAIEVRGGESGGGGTKQAVFDLSSGQFGGSDETDPVATDGATDPLDPATEDVLEELRDLDVNETPPVELLAKVQEWQDELDEN